MNLSLHIGPIVSLIAGILILLVPRLLNYIVPDRVHVLAGGMIIRDPWLVGPYLQTIAVLPVFQSSGIGGLMLDWFEARARLARQRNIWLCVSAFNSAAQKFYLAHGWEHIADLPDLIREGDGELLMRKRLA